MGLLKSLNLEIMDIAVEILSLGGTEPEMRDNLLPSIATHLLKNTIATILGLN